MPVEEQPHEQDQPTRAGDDQRGSPAELQREPHHHEGRERIAQVAAERMEAVGAAVAGAAHARGENGEVGGVEHAVAEARECGQREQHPELRRQPGQGDRGTEQRKPAQQHRPRRKAVNQEARPGLRDAGGDVEDRHQRAELGVAYREGLLKMGEERRQRELVEVARAVGEGGQPDDAGLPAAGHLLSGHRSSSRKGAA